MFRPSNFAPTKHRLLIVALITFVAGCSDKSSGEAEIAVEVSANDVSTDTTDNVAVIVPQQPAVDVTQPQMAKGSMGGMSKMAMPKSSDIVFQDNVETNVTVPKGLSGLLFVDTDGKRVQVSDYMGRKRVILVFTEGFAGMLCPFCKTQTARLVANYDKFRALDTEILVVYPGERDHIEEFVEAARTTDKGQVDRVPFPIVLDPKMEAVDFFNIRSKLAHPSTYLIDKNGKVQFAYVGNDMTADRPSIKAMLRTIEAAAARETAGG